MVPGPNGIWSSPMPNTSDEELQRTYASLAAQVVVYGHVHSSGTYADCEDDRRDTGGVRPTDGDRRASYLVIDGESIAIRRVEYDVESEAIDLLRSGLPHADWLYRILLAGKYCPPG